MSPPELLRKKQSDHEIRIKSFTSLKSRIVEVAEDKLDDMYCPGWVRCALLFLPITAAAAIFSGYTYWKLQFGQLLILRALGMNMNTRMLFSMIDLIISVPTHFKALLDAVSILTPAKRRPNLRLLGDSVPTVDVIITTCKEPTDICLDTIRAAIDMDYPISRFRVIVSDDGQDMDLQRGVDSMSETKAGAQLFYTSRVKGRDDRHKAGNLNHALSFTRSLPGGASEFTAGLDADMIPMRQLLRAQMPHMLLDSKLAVTCPPATFYNVPLNDPLLQGQSVHNKWEEFSRDRINDAWCTGSGWVMRRCALDQLGGFPMQTIGEDAFCSTGISNLGWNTAFIQESLQYGLVPDTYSSHLKQHRRWKLGGLVIGVDKNFGLFGKNVRGLSFMQRSYWFYYPFRTLTSLLVTFSLFTGPFFMLSGIPPVVYATDADLKALAQASALSFICTFLLKCHMALKIGYRAIMMEQCNEIWIAPYHAITQLKTYILPTWLGGAALTFVPTGSIPNKLYERSARRRVSTSNRLRSILLKDGAIFHALFAVFSVVAVASVIANAHQQDPDHSARFAIHLLTHLGWMPLPWVFSLFACITPIRYALFPPTVPDREELLVRDPQTGVASPIKSARGVSWVPELLGFQNLHILAFVYSLAVLYYTSQW